LQVEVRGGVAADGRSISIASDRARVPGRVATLRADVEQLTGIHAFDWMLAALYAVAAALVVGSLLWRSPGTRIRGVLVVALAVGVAGIGALAVTFPDDTRTFLRTVDERAAALLVAALVLLVGAAIADFLVSRVASLIASARPFRRGRRGGDVALALVLVIAAVVAWVGIVKLDDRTISTYESAQSTPSGSATIEAEHELPAQPMDVALRGANDGYLSLDDGTVAHFVIGEGSQEFELGSVATGLESPRGLAVVGDSLIVADLGPLPCDDQRTQCKGENVAGAPSIVAGERRILQESDGRLVKFDIRPDGTLANRRIILDGIPVANSEHGLNAVTAGPDGRVYVTVGNLDRLATVPLTEAERARPHFDWLGTVLSLRPDGSDVRVFARGIRNVYDLTFDRSGRLYGADNDGETRTSWRREEVLQIHEGADYGYPDDGTFAPFARPRAPGLWVLDTVGSGGVEWLRWDGRATLLVGSCDDVLAVGLDEVDGAPAVTDRAAVRELLSVSGCVTGIERMSDGRLLVTLYTYGLTPRMYVVRLDS
jgi:hypothetical protein